MTGTVVTKLIDEERGKLVAGIPATMKKKLTGDP